ncbi:hypothetical protein ACGF0D_41430 [Kitasatospora sp. NPDC048298]|uniref:hypothetical protein n=1 Tax=Kitasatospora sp. NPDC048298 TaxID=3364049 RepID=UPI003721B18B
MGELVRGVPALWGGGSAQLSMVDRDDLARLIGALATGEHAAPSDVHHASHPEPVHVGDLLAALARYGVLVAPTGPDRPWGECLHLLAANPGRLSERQFGLVARDRWYRSEDIWRVADCPAGPGPLARIAAPWYRGALGPS